MVQFSAPVYQLCTVLTNSYLRSRIGFRTIGGGTASVLNVSNQFYDFFKFILVWHVLNPFTWQNWKFDQTMVKLLACFGGGFKCNRRVETIEKRHCFMTQIPHEIYRHSRTLQELKLDSNNIKGIGSILETSLRFFLKWRSIFLFLEKLERDIDYISFQFFYII